MEQLANSVITHVKESFSTYGPYVLPVVFGFWSYVTTTLSLAISQADKDNDGQFTNEELEELAVYLVKNSKTTVIKMIPEGLIRRLIQSLCKRRSGHFNVPPCPVCAKRETEEPEDVIHDIKERIEDAPAEIIKRTIRKAVSTKENR